MVITKPESAYLLAYLYNVVQLQENWGNQSVQYDQAFREWAATKELRVWGSGVASLDLMLGHTSFYNTPYLIISIV